MQTLIIIPTYNEKANIEKIIREVFSNLPLTDILVVDDNSPDATGQIAENLSRQDSRIKVIHRSSKMGLGSAYVAGFKYALMYNYDFVFEMDADFSHSPKYLPEFLKYASDYKLVLGSRYIRGGGVWDWQFYRKLLSLSANLFARIMLSLPYRDLTGGFKCYSIEVIKNLNLDSIISEGYLFQIETTYRAHRLGFPIKEIPIIFYGRKKGKSKISRGICLEIIWKLPWLRFLRI